ncbi:MAG: outer membrane protein [Bacteriovoracaceae bacterium]
MKIILLLSLTLLISFQVFALEIDEKLTLRVLKLSDTKKTMLINRGVEDGLAEGDHAKFFITTGVVARGVLVKVSPTRSVWSIYRLVNPELINLDGVMNLKIASAVKVSEDESRMIVKDPKVVPVARGDGQLDIPLADGADDLEKDINGNVATKTEKDEMASVMIGAEESRRSILHRNLEVYGIMNLNILSGSTKPDNGLVSATAEYKTMQMLLGGEYYFKHEDEWYSRFSFFPYLSYSSNSITAGTGAHTNITVIEYGGGVNWHPLSKPSETMTFIPFATIGIGAGNFASKSENTFPSTTSSSIQQYGSMSTFFIGAGLKYYWGNGFGIRTTLDYYMRSLNLAGVPETNNVAFDVSQNGIRSFVGLGYRW